MLDPFVERLQAATTSTPGYRKAERDLIRTRVRDGMTEFAKTGERHLGGRPPYGYLLADAGEHPNAKKRALGQRLHCLEPDP